LLGILEINFDHAFFGMNLYHYQEEDIVANLLKQKDVPEAGLNHVQFAYEKDRQLREIALQYGLEVLYLPHHILYYNI
jgi:hypothetical protein